MSQRCNFSLSPRRTCGSYAFNLLAHDGIDQGTLCDRHYWQNKAVQAVAEQERCTNDSARIDWLDDQFRAVVIGKNMDNEGAVGWLTNLGHWSEGWKKKRAVNLRAAIDAAMLSDADA